MKCVFLIGNGFDLSLGLQTNPRTILEKYIDKAKNSESPSEKSLAKAILDEGIDRWASFEFQLGRHSSDFAEDQADKYLDQADSFNGFLGNWLFNQESKVSEEYISKNYDNLKTLAGFHERLKALNEEAIERLLQNHKSENVVVDLLSFNYTNILKRMYDAIGGKNTVLGNRNVNSRYLLGDFVFAHESLDEEDIVCGVDRADQLGNAKFRENPAVVNCLVKEEMQTNVLFSNNRRRALQLISTANLICIFGMSLGETDQSWWESIAKRMSDDNTVLLVLFSHRASSPEKNYSPIRDFRVLTNCQDSFLKYVPESIEINRDRIIVASSDVVFIMPRIDANNENGSSII